MDRLEVIKNNAVGLTDNEGSFSDIIQLDVDDYAYLFEQAKKVQKIEYEIENSDMSTAVDNIISIVKGE